jgi:hypothetical protein
VPRAELVHPLRPPPGHARPAPEFRLDIADADGAGAGVAGRGRERGAVPPGAGPQEEGRSNAGECGIVAGGDGDRGFLDQGLPAGGHCGGRHRRWGFSWGAEGGRCGEWRRCRGGTVGVGVGGESEEPFWGLS